MFTKSAIRAYIAAVLIVAAASALRAAIGTLGVRIPFVTFYPAVMIAGIYGGMRAGLLATGLSAFLTAYFWLDPPGLWVSAPADQLILLIFVATCILLSYTADRMYRALERAKEADAQLEIAAERETAGIAIRQSEERFRVMANSIPQLAWIARADGYIYWYNSRWYAFTGTTPEQMEGWGWQSVHDPHTLPGVLERWGESISTGKPFEMVFPLRGADGKYRQFLTRAQPVKNADGEVIQWCGTNTDVTERMLLEAELRKARDELELRVRERTAELEEANSILRDHAALLDLAHDAILVRDMNDAIVFWSNGATETYGFTRDEAIGKITNSFLHTKFPLPLDQIKEAVMHKGRWQGELEHTTSEQRKLIVESRWALKHDVNGNPTGFLEINRDITDRKIAEEALKANMSRLELINSELQEFAFVASHDLQEPLRKIMTFCDLTKQRCSTSLDDTGQDYLERIISSAERMRQLLGDLLEFSRVATRPEPFRKIDIGKIAREAADIFERRIKETRAIIEIRDMPKIEVDEGQIFRLFQNLIGNALKFRGQESPRIEVYSTCNGDKFCDIFVKDNGIGFEPQYAESIFKPFQRLHGRSQYEGTGMGLAICRKIAERHGGTIRVESEPGKGSTFIVRLPVKQWNPVLKGL